MPGSEGPRCPLSVHVNFLAPTIDLVLLKLSDVMRDIVNYIHSKRFSVFTQHLLEGLPDTVNDHLAVRPSVVRSAFHGGEVILSLW